MAKDNEDFSAAHASIIGKWTRDKERAEMTAEHAEKKTAKAIANILKQQDNRINIAKDLKRATENRKEYKRSEGFGAKEFDDIDDIITGFEDQPWNRDLND